MSPKFESAIAVIGIDIGKNSFHVVGHDQRGAIVLRQKWSRGQVETRLISMLLMWLGIVQLMRKVSGLWGDRVDVSNE